MADRGIIFSAPMVRALLAGRKTQTRRLITKAAAVDALAIFKPAFLSLPGNIDLLPHRPGDRLYVREAFAERDAVRFAERRKGVVYRADIPATEPPKTDGPVAHDRLRWACAQGLKWRPSIHMPRWASRLTLTVTDVRVQRVQEISEEDAEAEGLMRYRFDDPDGSTRRRFHWLDDVEREDAFRRASTAFSGLWNSLHTKPGERWEDNPWIYALTFEVARGNIDRTAS